jgi:hypothetical protein
VRGEKALKEGDALRRRNVRQSHEAGMECSLSENQGAEILVERHKHSSLRKRLG